MEPDEDHVHVDPLCYVNVDAVGLDVKLKIDSPHHEAEATLPWLDALIVGLHLVRFAGVAFWRRWRP